MISAQSVTKDFGDSKGIFGVNLEINESRVYGLLGPNGAGKTTFIRVLMSFIKADKGDAFIGGLSCKTQPQKIHKILGYLPAEIALPENLGAMELIKEVASYRKMQSIDRAAELSEYLSLDTRLKVKRMSKGTKQKLAIVLAFMHDPKVLILDEPSTGLDPLFQRKLIDLIKTEKDRGKTVLISTHYFVEVEKVCDSFSIIKNGKIVATDEVGKIDDLETYFMEFYKEDYDV